MKYGHCKNHPAIYAQNSRGLCAECTREKHRQSAESKGLIIKQKNDNRGNKTAIHAVDNGLQEPNQRIWTNQRQYAENEAENDKPKKDATKNTIGRTKSKIKHRSKKGAELLLFKKIFNERPPFCEWCGTSITVYSPCNYHHIKTKGSHPELRLVESNIVKICVECHLKVHSFRPVGKWH